MAASARPAVGTPAASIVPDSLSATIASGDSATRTLTLRNTGADALTFSISGPISAAPATTATRIAIPAFPEKPDSVFTRLDPSENRRQKAPSLARARALSTLQAASGVPVGSALVIGDGGTESDVGAALAGAGYQVTVIGDDSGWTGTNPAPQSFNLVVLLDGIGFGTDMPLAGQTTLLSYVEHGGGLIVTEWSSWEVAQGRYQAIQALIPSTRSSGGTGVFTNVVVATHPVTAGVAASFHVSSGISHGVLNSGTAVVELPGGEPAVVVKQQGQGRLVYFAHAGNYFGFRPFTDPNLQQLLVNAANWVRGSVWLTAAPTSGFVDPGQSLALSVGISARSLPVGVYTDRLRIATNDPLNPEIDVPVRAAVGIAPVIDLLPAAIDFGSKPLGAADTVLLQVRNLGSDILNVSDISSGSAAFEVLGSHTFSLVTGQSNNVPIRMGRASLGTFSSAVSITSNDPSRPVAQVSVTGVVVQPPVLTLAPTSLDLSASSGSSATTTLNVGNSGPGSLAFQFLAANAAWLSRAPTSGTVAPGTQQPVSVQASAASLFAGTYLDTLVITTNDPAPARARVSIPVRFVVSGQPAILTTPDTVRFSPAWAGVPTHQTLTIRNTGTASLHLGAFSFTNARFHVGGASPSVVGPAQQADVDIVCDSPAPGTESGAINLTSDDPAHPTLAIRVEAVVQQPGLARLQPTSLGLTLDQDATADAGLTLSNDGPGPLGYSIGSAPGWLAFTPAAGTIPPAGSVPITAHFNASGLAPGTFTASPLLSTTDPRATSIPIPVTLQVDGLPPAPPVASAPLDGQINVPVRAQFRWGAASRALHYELYVWRSVDPVPATPVASLTQTAYTFSTPLLAGTDYRWKVLSIDATGSASGPVQSFRTELLPDLAVTLVEAPPTAFSGQPVSVHFVVTNQGMNGTNAPSWVDQVYLSPSSTFDPFTAVPVAALQNPAYLAPGESYSVNASFVLPRDAVGPYYAFVTTDLRTELNESNESNNRSAPSPTMQVLLTPPPNLVVTPPVTAPANPFTGQSYVVSWSVKNDRSGATRESEWVDAVYLSADAVLSPGSDVLLGTAAHTGVLAPGASYSRSLTVTMPQVITWPNYFLVVTDAANQVFEHVFESDNVTSSPVTIRLTPPPDFTVSSVTAPASAQSGQLLHVQWTVTNSGAGDSFEHAWFDGVYLCPTATFDPATSVQLGTVQRAAPLVHDEFYTVDDDFTVPIEVSGTFYVFVLADIGNGVFEGNQDGNNQGRSSAATVVTLTPPPNLFPTLVSAQASGRGEDPLGVSWTVENRGTGATAGASWTDRAYLVSGTTWDPSHVLASANVGHSGALAVNGHYTVSVSLTPPASYVGAARVFVDVDASNNVFENQNEGDNRGTSGSVTVSAALPADLIASWRSSPAQASQGATLDVTWTVRNQGQRATLAAAWLDHVYLSANATFDPGTDVPLAVVGHSGVLAVGDAYDRGASIAMPELPPGGYHLLVVADGTGLVLDSQRANNVAAIPITLLARPPSPDLRVTQLTAPAQVMAGQSLPVSWTVQNQGPGAAAGASWYDAIFLSSDPFVDAGDARIASLQHSGALAPGAGYSTSLGVEIPGYFAGNYYLIVAADSRNDELEFGNEDNNSAGTVVLVQVPPPCDLVVTDMVVPPTAIPGQPVTVSWTLANVGANRVTGSLRDGVYVSSDATWDVGDPVVGLLDHLIDLAPGAQAKLSAQVDVGKPLQATSTGDVIAPLPGLTPGPYRFIVRTDLRNVIRESDDTNNLRVADATTDVDVAQMSLDTPVPIGLANGQQRFFKLVVPAGLDLRFDLTGGTESGWGEIYVASGRVPTLSNFDVAATLPFSPSERALVPTTQAGAYYVMLMGRGFGVSGGTLTASARPFEVVEGTPKNGGLGGIITCRYRGAGFQVGMQAQLREVGGALFPASKVTRISSNECVVVWNLDGLQKGLHDVIFTNPGGAAAPPLVGGLEVEDRLPFEISASRNAPTAFRAGGSVVVTMEFENVGNVDIPFALVTIEVPAGQDVRITSDRLMPLTRFFDPANPGAATQYYESGGTRYIPLLALDLTVQEIIRCTVVAPSTGLSRLPLRVRAIGMGSAAFAIALIANVEQLRNLVLASPTEFDPTLALLAPAPKDFRNHVLDPLYSRGLIDRSFADHVVEHPSSPGAAGGEQIPDGCEQQHTAFGCYLDIAGCVAGGIVTLLTGGVGIGLWALGCTASIGIGCVIEPNDFPPGFGLTLSSAHKLIDVYEFTENFNPVFAAKVAVEGGAAIYYNNICPLLIRSSDPNDIQGPAGIGPERWVAKTGSMPYVIHFENDSTRATGPARSIEIRQPLDAKLDARTFRLGHIGIGPVTVDVPENRAFTSQRVDLQDSLGVFVDVSAGVDVLTHEAFWVLRAIDPATNQPPENPFLGLLPVNDASGRGEGFVSYTISPVATVATGDTASAKATIVFDGNDPIDTPEFQNLFDGAPPSTRVNVMPDGVPPGPFIVTWSGKDDARGSGLAAFDVYMRRGSAPDSLWLSNTTDTSGVFEAVLGQSYGFYSVGIDRVGQREPAPATPDVTVGTLGQGTDAPPRPAVLALYGARPNPGRGDFAVAFSLASREPAVLELFDVAGRRVLSQQVGGLGPGPHVVRLGSAHDVRPGIYVVRLTAGNRRLKTKAVVVE